MSTPIPQIRVFVGGVDVGAYRDASQGLSWTSQVNGRGSLSVTFRSRLGDWAPEDGAEIVIYRDVPSPLATRDGAAILAADAEATPIQTGPSRLFGGIILEPEERVIPGSNGTAPDGTPQPVMMVYQTQASEFAAICDRRIVSRIYEQETVGEIVRDIVKRDLSGEGANTWGVVAAGPVIEKAVFADVTVTQALNQLAELTGNTWRIDPYRVLQFQPREALHAPLPLDGTTLLAEGARVRPDRQKYRNVQIVRAGTDLTDPRSEIRVGDGAARAFPVAFPIGSVPTIEVSRAGGAWVAQTVGILGVETGKAWYWTQGQAQVSQDDSATLLAAPTTPGNPATGDRVRVTYRGLFPVKTSYQDTAEIAARKAIEGGSGVYTSVEDRTNINSAQSAIDTAVALIERYGTIGKILTAVSRSADFAPGQVATVDLPEFGLVGASMLIESVSADYSAEIDEVWYTITARTGDAFGGWQEYFRKLAQVGRQMIIGREGEILVLLRSAAETAECDAAVALETEAPESRIGLMQIGTGEIGAP
ncbi:MAG: hypothetical protein QUU85_14480 [Candidatus Eisenbacteria bacterium]|nr:hypothetical protein [Candidatus Eisenbacteria bacterium]